MRTFELINDAAKNLIGTLITMGFPESTIAYTEASDGDDEVTIKFKPPGLVPGSEVDVRVAVSYDDPPGWSIEFYVSCRRAGGEFVRSPGDPSVGAALYYLGQAVFFCSR